MKIIKILLAVSCIAYAQEAPVRVIGHEVSYADQIKMQPIDYVTDLKLDETVAVNRNGCWLYARVQSLPKVPLWLGLVNWCHDDSKETRGGQVINFQRHVQKFPAQKQQSG